uniref:IPT/TIG domain-containing protein n=1 Tax=Capitella teleta TaxID=283909 RepID=X2A1J6_CAPTE
MSSSSQLDAYVFETKAVNTPGAVPITIVIPLRNDIHAITLDQNFTFEDRTPKVKDIHPKELTVHGGTELTVVGSNFEAESNPQMNLTQKAINTLDGTKTFDEVKYPPTISWGHFQHEAVVRVGGMRSNITERLVNRLLFLPPDEAQLDPESGCKNSKESHLVEVAAGNTNRHVGCLTYDPDDDTPLRMILVFAVYCVVAVVVVVSIIAFYIVQKRKNTDGE